MGDEKLKTASSVLIRLAGGLLRFTGDKRSLSATDKNHIRGAAVNIREIADELAQLTAANDERDRYKALVGKARKIVLEPEYFNERRLQITKNLIGPQWYVLEGNDVIGPVVYSPLEAFEALTEAASGGGENL